jgi:hypothetical protein
MNKVVNENISAKDLFKRWLDISQPYHKLKGQYKEVLALLLYYHFKYSKQITNKKILWKIVFDYDTKKLIKDELDIKDQAIQNALTALRKKNIIVNNTITPAFIPEITSKTTKFKIEFNFNIIHE